MGLKLHACRNLVNAFKKLNPDILMQQVLKESSSLQQDILDLDRDDQLYNKGITADGIELGNYSPATIEGNGRFAGKKAKGQRYDHITLKDTGEFYASLKIKIEREDFIISGETKKPDVDLTTYGNILGLTQQNKMVLAGWVKAPFVSQMRRSVWK